MYGIRYGRAGGGGRERGNTSMKVVQGKCRSFYLLVCLLGQWAYSGILMGSNLHSFRFLPSRRMSTFFIPLSTV